MKRFGIMVGVLVLPFLAGSWAMSADKKADEDKKPLPAGEVIKPAPLAGEQATVNLPSAVQRSCAGGGGRYLILHLPQQRKLAVFDSNEAKIVKYLPVAEDTVYFAAGLDKLFVGLPSNNVLQRWDLKTFEKEVTVASPVPVKDLAMGSASCEPLVVQSGEEGGLTFLDPQTFKKSDYRTAGVGRHFGGGQGGGPLHISANGQVITGPVALVREGKTYKGVDVPGLAPPSADGRVLYTVGQLYTAGGKAIGQRFGGHGQMIWFVLALQGPYALSYSEKGGNGPQKARWAFI